jgi:hypothetical protein
MRIFSDVALIVNGGWWLKKKNLWKKLSGSAPRFQILFDATRRCPIKPVSGLTQVIAITL